MPTSRWRVQIWGEDRNHEAFAVRLLRVLLGDDTVIIRRNIAPRGGGSAADWVMKQYSRVEQLYRTSSHQQQLGFVVLIDGDRVGLRARKISLCGSPDRRNASDRIAILVPTWSIETWVLWLTASDKPEFTVGESRSLKDRLPSAEFHRRVDDAVSGWPSVREGEDAIVPSLADASRELDRLR